MAPPVTVPQNVRHHSGLFWLSTATRSPWPTPAPPSATGRCSAWATPLAVVMNRSKDQVSSPYWRNVCSPRSIDSLGISRRSGRRSL